jgi:hypothetical protein
MKSKKQKSRKPRPFKGPSEAREWAGGKRDDLREAFAKAMSQMTKPARPFIAPGTATPPAEES